MHSRIQIMTRFLILCFLIVFPAIARGYDSGDEEDHRKVIEAENGNKISFVWLSADDIMHGPPLRLEIRECEDNCASFFGTDYGRDVLVSCSGNQKCLIFLYKDFFSVVPQDAYEFEINARKVTKTDATGVKIYGIFLPLLQNLFSYLFLAIILIFPMILSAYPIRQLYESSKEKNKLRTPKLSFCIILLLISIILLLASIWIDFMWLVFSELFFWPFAVLTGITMGIAVIIFLLKFRRAKQK